MTAFKLQTAPFQVPADDGKTILEHFGRASISAGDISIAHMHAPSGWAEPAQTPQFDEVTLMLSGRKQVEVDGQTIVVGAQESILIERGTRVRYSNPFPEPAVYVAICVPAFTLEAANRED